MMLSVLLSYFIEPKIFLFLFNFQLNICILKKKKKFFYSKKKTAQILYQILAIYNCKLIYQYDLTNLTINLPITLQKLINIMYKFNF
jgi:hypothetical protein